MTEAPIITPAELRRFEGFALEQTDIHLRTHYLRVLAAARRGVEADVRVYETLVHGMNCPALAGRDDACTCGLVFRQQTQTAENISAAWRQRAETAEAALVEAREHADRERTLLAETHEDAIKDLVKHHAAELAEAVRREGAGMTPTAKFRWLELSHDEEALHPSSIILSNHGRVLQKWWESSYEGESGEWRDIPIEEQA